MVLDSLPVAPRPPDAARRRAAISLSCRPVSVPPARRFVREVLRRWDLEAYEEEAGTGRGLWLLDQYSRRAGVDVRYGSGKQVWAVQCPDVAGLDDTALSTWLDQVESP